MMSGRYRWLLTVLRYGLCVAAIVFLAYTVPWHDHIRLHDGAQTPLRLLEVTAAGFVVERDGARVTLPPEDIEHVTVRGALVPRIEYGLPSVVLQCDAGGAIWAIVLFLPVPLLAAIRLTWMLRVQTVRLSTWDSIKLTFAGNFFNFALPGMTGGDLIKAYYITRFTKHKTEAVTTIFLDRAVGLASLVLMAGVMIALTHDPQEFADLIVPLAVILGGLALGTVIVYSRRIRRTLRLRQLIERLPMTNQLQRIGEATLAMRQHKLLVIGSLILTFILHTIVIVSAIVMARALGMHGSFAFFFIYIAIGFVISAVPISPPQAIGVMEFFYVWFFTANELNTASQAFALAVAVRLIQLIWALPGVLVPLLGAHMPKRSELQALEEAKEPTSAVSGP